jgi:hypothetical protein
MKMPKQITNSVQIKAIRDGRDKSRGVECGFHNGDIFFIDKDELQELELISKGFVVLWPEKPEVAKAEEVKDSEKANCLWLKPHIGWAYAEGKTARLPKKDIEILVAGGYVSWLPDDYVKPEPEKAPPLDGPKVVFLNCEPTYACSKGTIMKTYKKEAIRLLDWGFVDLATNDKKERNQIFKDLGYIIDPINKKLVKY